MIRPTIGNTVAIGRFSPGGVTGYAPVYRDGAFGPLYATRAEAEEDFARRECPTCHGTGAVADGYGEHEACDDCDAVCVFCEGTGRQDDRPCWNCGGSGSDREPIGATN